MTIQELQNQYANGTISYEEYENKINEIRNNVGSITRHNNSWYFLAGIGVISFILLYLSKRGK